MTPLMKQYTAIKEEYADCILFFRMGDFYELFGKDAIVAARILSITLTKRNNGKDGKTELCGFPFHAAERYIPKMVNAGFKVAICEQVEDPKEAKGIVKREVIEVITAGTTLNEQNLDAKQNNYLVAINGSSPEQFQIAALDLSTGDFYYLAGDFSDLECELFRIQAKEILVSEDFPLSFSEEFENLNQYDHCLISTISKDFFDRTRCEALLKKQLKVQSLEGQGLGNNDAEISVCGAVLAYSLNHKKSELDHITSIYRRDLHQFMVLDPSTIRNLELVEPLNANDKSSTLLHVLDHTATSMGARTLRQWITRPLLDPEQILKRQNTITLFTENIVLRESLYKEMRGINDLERLMARLCSGRINPKELLAIGKSLNRACDCAELLKGHDDPFFAEFLQTIPEIREKSEKITTTLVDEPPLTMREGKMIRPGSSEKLDALNEGIREARDWLANLESHQRELTGIPSLKVGYNKVFGYYLEVSRTHMDKIPDSYIRKQTLANAERFITPEMKEYESIILNAEGEINEVEFALFTTLREEVKSWFPEILQLSESLSNIDVLNSLAEVALQENFAKPLIVQEPRLEILQGFHPVIVHNNKDLQFIHNDTHLHNEECRMMLITGPNMAGKSTYLRQTGLIVLLAQIGSFVPAESAVLGIHDRIFTRVGASDRLSRGQSTFMVEMVETANILNHASPKSLILLDEIGRGTSTFDGLSLAWSLVEELHNNPKLSGKTLFATHYHELTALVDELGHARNYRVTVQDNDGHLVFLRKVVQGASDSSYGIQVAKMAGLSPSVVERASQILLDLENSSQNTHLPQVAEANPSYSTQGQQDLFGIVKVNKNHEKLYKRLEKTDPNDLTPLQALQLIFQLKTKFFPED